MVEKVNGRTPVDEPQDGYGQTELTGQHMRIPIDTITVNPPELSTVTVTRTRVVQASSIVRRGEGHLCHHGPDR